MVETEEASVAGLIGEKPYQEQARQALPILVRQAKAGRTIYYSELANEIGIPSPRTLGWPLGAIGNEMLKLGERWECKVPPIQAVVVSKKSNLPGDGISWFAPDAAQFKTSPVRVRKQIVDLMLTEVYAFTRWDKVLETYGLTPVPPLSLALPSLDEVQAVGGTGEGEEHYQLKHAVAAHPEWLGLPPTFGIGDTECALFSGDRVDVIFSGARRRIAVEVKPEHAPLADIIRGLFQCVKYEAVMQAEERMWQSQRKCSAILVLGGQLPIEASSLRVTLGVDVRDCMADREV